MKYLYSPGDVKVRAHRRGHVCPNCHNQNWWSPARLLQQYPHMLHTCVCGKQGTTDDHTYYPITEMRGTPR